jgi:alpha-L-fucosidase
MGSWLKKNGYTIYGTHAGYMKPQDWGAITERGNSVYLHIFKTDGDKFFVKIPYKVRTAEMNGQLLQVKVLGDNYIMIDLKGILLDPVDAIIKLEVDK